MKETCCLALKGAFVDLLDAGDRELEDESMFWLLEVVLSAVEEDAFLQGEEVAQ